MIPKEADIVVIGGGPAGSLASALLAKEGYKVVLLEKEYFPRETVGESLIPHFWKFADLIGVSEQVKKAGFIQKSGGAAYWNESLKAMNFAPYGHNRPGLHVERDEFDNIFLTRSKELGTMVAEGCKVTSVTISENKNTVTYTDENDEKRSITSRFLIDASGQAAVVSKQLGTREFDPDFRFQAFWGYFDESNYLNKNGEVTSFEQRFNDHPLSLVSGTGDWGWSWQLVLKNKVSVGALIPKSRLANFKANGKDMNSRFLAHVGEIPLTGSLINGQLIGDVHTVRDYAYLPAKLAFDQCYLIGDAAAFADPINSEGVTMALYGGMMAAWAIQKTLENEKRADFYREMYINNLSKRYQVFQLLSYPKEQIAPHLLESCMNVIKNQSEDETNLILAHLMVTNRASDFPELLEAMKIPIKKGWRELTVEKTLIG